MLIGERLSPNRHAALILEWHKAQDRTLDDAGGAITSAKSLLEATCKQILDELAIKYSPSADLPKLYTLATQAIGIAPGTQTEPILRSMFSAAHQIMQSVAEMRNKFGDSHGKSMGTTKPSRAQGELAVNLSASLSCFLITQLDSHLSATRRLTKSGKAILKFDKSVVWQLIDHAANAPQSRPYWGEEVGRCLLLVGNSGIYLMSNGIPPISHRGKVPRENEEPEFPSLIAEAEGCGAFNEVDDWWPIHHVFDEGSDFSWPISIDEFSSPLQEAISQLVIIANSDDYTIMSDLEFSRTEIE